MKSPATYAGDPRHHADDLAELRAENERLKALAAYIHLHIGRHVEKQLTTEQKELLYDTTAEVYGPSEWTEGRWWRS